MNELDTSIDFERMVRYLTDHWGAWGVVTCPEFVDIINLKPGERRIGTGPTLREALRAACGWVEKQRVG